jgi:hypothetical protein
MLLKSGDSKFLRSKNHSKLQKTYLSCPHLVNLFKVKRGWNFEVSRDPRIAKNRVFVLGEAVPHLQLYS